MADAPIKLDPRVAFAAERTLLAWVRTGLAMMGFGFVVSRFGWLMREVGAIAHKDTAPGMAVGAGIALIAIGVLTNIVGAIQHEANMRRLRSGQDLDAGSSHRATAVALTLAVIGIVMAAYVFSAAN
ncbi:MAG: DUF202 domain-containing protein [Deltaproteobacteria bacterium]|nr:DUF202 domain-containing protein [Deltaproteobacteria bacterium]